MTPIVILIKDHFLNHPLEKASKPDLDDGFTVVRNMKKRKGSDKPFSPQIVSPSQCYDLVESPTSTTKIFKPSLNPLNVQPKVFREIDDDYIFEIIPASGSTQQDINMDMDSTNIDFNTLKRCGRPSKSKNKNGNKKSGDNPCNPSMSLEDVCQGFFNLSQ